MLGIGRNTLWRKLASFGAAAVLHEDAPGSAVGP